jgi:hypothetical protein
MNLLHALGFFVLGLAMMIWPELAPAIAVRHAAFGDVSGLWLKFMGAVIFFIGSGVTAKCLALAWPKPAPRRTVASTSLSAAQADSRSALATTANRAAI